MCSSDLELNKIAQAMETPDPALALDTLYAPPNKFRDGTIVKADGTTWNPGSGEGAYCFYASAWHFLGGGGGSPGGSTTQVQFNDAGAFAGDAHFTWDKVSNVLTLGTLATSGTIKGAPPASATDDGVGIQFIGGTGGATSGAGGFAVLYAGDAAGGDSFGGQGEVISGDGSGVGPGGDQYIGAGAGGATGDGGGMYVYGGNGGATSGVGGLLSLRSGAASGGNSSGGALAIAVGSSSGSIVGTDLTLAAGGSDGTGAGGVVQITGGIPVAGNGGGVSIRGSAGFGTNKNGGSVTLTAGVGSGAGSAGYVNLSGSGSALATTTTDGFTCLPTCAGVPSGTPVALPAGTVPMVVDTSSGTGRLYIRIGSTWRYAALT